MRSWSALVCVRLMVVPRGLPTAGYGVDGQSTSTVAHSVQEGPKIVGMSCKINANLTFLHCGDCVEMECHNFIEIDETSYKDLEKKQIELLRKENIVYHFMNCLYMISQNFRIHNFLTILFLAQDIS